jgi:hypothetical protein
MRGLTVVLKGITVAVVVVAALGLVGCGGGGGGGGSVGTLQVAMTDSPGTYAKVVVTIQEIRAVPAGEGSADTGPGLPLIATLTPPVAVDVLSLQFAQQVLGSALVPAGSYEQIRLVLAPNVAGSDPVNYVTLPSDPTTKIPLTTPSGQESGLKIVGNFTVEAGKINAIVLDFNPDKAIVVTGGGKHLLKPTGIRVVQVPGGLTTFGSISGNVMPDTAWPSAVVSVIPQGSTTAVAAGSVSPDDGTFVAFVPAGTYYLVVTATGFATYDSSALGTPVFYTVAVGADTPAGTITLTP